MELTLPERLWLWRRRQGLSQRKAALVVGCGVSTYQRLERGETRPDKWLGDIPLPDAPSPGEIVRLLRRRTGWSLYTTCLKLDVRKEILYAIEKDEEVLSQEDLRAIAYTMGFTIDQ